LRSYVSLGARRPLVSYGTYDTGLIAVRRWMFGSVLSMHGVQRPVLWEEETANGPFPHSRRRLGVQGSMCSCRAHRRQRACDVRHGLILFVSTTSGRGGLAGGGDCVIRLPTMLCSPLRWRHVAVFGDKASHEGGRVDGVTFLFDWSGDASLSAVVRLREGFLYAWCAASRTRRDQRGGCRGATARTALAFA